MLLQRTGVGKDPQLGGGVVDISGGRESRGSGSSAVVVMFIADVAGVVERALLVDEVGGGHE
jgi:hypothetical protein